MKTQLDLYKDRQSEIVRQYNGQIIAVVDRDVVGVFTSKTLALREMSRKYLPGEFLIIKCTPGDEEYTRRYRSRAILHKEVSNVMS
ncbi:hypothetical protein LJC22_02350 [Desulfosarcina sp. OttesenSCG-928-G10]|nr:hypothetical protein [Desulfosarcina sp. OttesenSCG-928-G10]